MCVLSVVKDGVDAVEVEEECTAGIADMVEDDVDDDGLEFLIRES